MTTETDSELLELAAKAAGIVGRYGQASDDYYYRGNTHGIITTLQNCNDYVWNPLEDDGDALRLAVKLATDSPGASFEISISKMWNGRGSTHAGFRSKDNPTHNAMDDDIASSTRRAIVRAAAEIGMDME